MDQEQQDTQSENIDELASNVSDIKTLLIFIFIFILVNTIIFGGYWLLMFMNGPK